MRKFQTRGVSGFQTLCAFLDFFPSLFALQGETRGRSQEEQTILPSIALQNTSVTARTMIDVEDAGVTIVTASPTKEAAGTPGRSRRFSFVLSDGVKVGVGWGKARASLKV